LKREEAVEEAGARESPPPPFATTRRHPRHDLGAQVVPIAEGQALICRADVVMFEGLVVGGHYTPPSVVELFGKEVAEVGHFARSLIMASANS
jgi:hypothetical protein